MIKAEAKTTFSPPKVGTGTPLRQIQQGGNKTNSTPATQHQDQVCLCESSPLSFPVSTSHPTPLKKSSKSKGRGWADRSDVQETSFVSPNYWSMLKGDRPNKKSDAQPESTTQTSQISHVSQTRKCESHQKVAISVNPKDDKEPTKAQQADSQTVNGQTLHSQYVSILCQPGFQSFGAGGTPHGPCKEPRIPAEVKKKWFPRKKYLLRNRKRKTQKPSPGPRLSKKTHKKPRNRRDGDNRRSGSLKNMRYGSVCFER